MSEPTLIERLRLWSTDEGDDGLCAGPALCREAAAALQAAEERERRLREALHEIRYGSGIEHEQRSYIVVQIGHGAWAEADAALRETPCE